MNRITRILGILAGVGAALLGILATGSAAFAYDVPPNGGGAQPVQVVTNGGTAGWQITLIALGAALFASIIAVVADRSWLARHRSAASA